MLSSSHPIIDTLVHFFDLSSLGVYYEKNRARGRSLWVFDWQGTNNLTAESTVMFAICERMKYGTDKSISVKMAREHKAS